MKLILINDPILRKPTKPVSAEELVDVVSCVADMKIVMDQEGGMGLAANQVGLSDRFFILKSDRNPDGVELFINPEIVEMSTYKLYNEGCLSIPGVTAETRRASTLKLKYRNSAFEEVEEVFTDMQAVAVQHEVDHLDGKLYIDQFQPVKQMMVLKKHKKFLKMSRR